MTERTYCPRCNTGFEYPWARCPICRSRFKTYRSATAGRTRRKIGHIADRDGWWCHLCGEVIDPKARGEYGATLDHVVPRSLGGGDGMHNLKLAHYVCNNRRGNAVLPEAAA